jgi:hypothetical protein
MKTVTAAGGQGFPEFVPPPLFPVAAFFFVSSAESG